MSFNPRTYIRYDKTRLSLQLPLFRFQSTYLYKVRQRDSYCYFDGTCFNPRTYIRYDGLFGSIGANKRQFQSTYLYKVRRTCLTSATNNTSFNPRTYIRYDTDEQELRSLYLCFNPRTYIRYDGVAPLVGLTTYVSIHVPI